MEKQLYQVFLKIANFCVPNESTEFTDSLCEEKAERVHKIINVEDVNLGKSLELPANQRICILHDVVGTDRVNREPSSIRCLQPRRKCFLLPSCPRSMGSMPQILNNPEKNGMQNLYRSVLSGIKPCKFIRDRKPALWAYHPR